MALAAAWPALSGVSLGLAMAALSLPLQALAQTPPAPRAVPIPSASWRVYGNGGAAPVNVNNARGGVDQTISQASQRAIYNWNSFDIGAASSVTFDMALPGASALNRVTAGTAPSRVFGQLKATNGGEVYLINRNGILFGSTAQVNVGSLVASTLNITDDEFRSGLVNSISAGNLATFAYDGAPENFIDSKNFVRLSDGASITTGSGGRVFLFAKKVENDGAISTPDGQTVLAAGGQIFAELPTDKPLYAAESNPAVPVLRGLLIEVGNGPTNALPTGDGTGSVVNGASGVITTARGNTTLVGLAVNQSGRISATTSVSANGSILLRAQGNAQPVSGGTLVEQATEGGALTLDPGSLTTITPDTTPGADGKPRTSTDNAGFIASRIDLAGKTIELQNGAQVIAPGANVYLRAEAVPGYFRDLTTGTLLPGNADTRIALDAGATIDVSGTTDTVASVDRFFVTTDLLGSNDLKDAPVQKDGLLYRSKVTVDVRGTSPILGDLSSYRNALERTVEERLSAGGHVSLFAGGAVLTDATSRIDVSGGQVAYTPALVRPTELLGSDGNLYSLNNAPANLVYSQGFNLQKSSQATFDRWGVKVAYGTAPPAQTELGYVQGSAAGQLLIAAPTVVLDGVLAAHTVAGTRQTTGVDALPAGGVLNIGAVVNGGRDFNDLTYSDAVLKNFSLARSAPSLPADFWLDPLQAELPVSSGAAASTLLDAGFTQVAVAADGNVATGPTAALPLAPESGLRLLSLDGKVTLGAAVSSAGGSVELGSKADAVGVAAGVQVDLSGRWVNQALEGPLSTAGTTGGAFNTHGLGVSLAAGAVVDVSGGAVVSAQGTFTGADAGNIALADTQIDPQGAGLTLGGANGAASAGQLRGYSAAGGGTLSLATAHVRVADAADKDATTFDLTPDFFKQGGFASFSVNGRLSNEVAPGTVIAPSRQAWQAPLNAALVPTGSVTADVVGQGLPPGVLPKPVNLALSAGGDKNAPLEGKLTFGAGAVLTTTPQASVTLSAANRLDFEGAIVDHGGTVAMTLGGPGAAEQSAYLWLGAGSSVDVSGTTLLTPTTNGLRQGKVIDGGSIMLNAAGSAFSSSLVLQKGASLDASGSADLLDVSLQTTAGSRTVRQTVASQGGALTLAGNRDIRVEGDIALGGGGPTAAGGALTVKLTAGTDGASPPVTLAPRQLTLTNYAGTTTVGLRPEDLAASADLTGRASVSVQTVAESDAADFTASAIDTVRFFASQTLALPRNLQIQARGISAAPDAQVSLSAANITLAQADVGNLPDGVSARPAPLATAGTADVQFNATSGLVLDGQIATQGIGQLALNSGGDMRLQGSQLNAYQGKLSTLADVSLLAQQIYPGSATQFTLDAAGHAVTIAAAATPAPSTPLSAGGSLQISAATIEQDGVLRAPMGEIALNAAEQLTLGAGSQTSVSADGASLPYGTTSGGQWLDPLSQPLTTAPTKRIALTSPNVQVQGGAAVDLSGGGDLVAHEFVPGPGGSTDIFAGGNGAYAIVPGVQGLAPFDPAYAATGAHIGRQIEIGAGGPLPAGVYTLLPARYALQPGAFLVRPATAANSVGVGAGLDLGVGVAQADGSVVVGARLRDAGTGFADALPSNWQVLPQAVARRYSEISDTSANSYFAAAAAQAGGLTPQLPADAGTLVVAAQQARLQGRFDFAPAPAADGQAAGRGGRAEFAAQTIEVDAADNAATDGALHLTAATLNALGAQTVLLGATSGTAAVDASGNVAPTPLNVVADAVTFAQGAQTLKLPDLVALSSGSITVSPGAQFAAVPASQSAAAPTAFSVEGDGAALRITGATGASLQRSNTSDGSGRLGIGTGSRFDAAGGSLVLDSSGTNNLGVGVAFAAADLALSANGIVIGGAPSQTVLALTPALTAAVNQSEKLTLKAYTQIDLRDGAALGGDTLKELVLDTPRLRALDATDAGASVTAGDITLTNTTGTRVGAAPAGVGLLTLHARDAAGGSGVLHFGDGTTGFNGVGTLTMVADKAAELNGTQSLFAPGDVSLTTPGIVAQGLATALTLNAPGHVAFNAPTGALAALPASLDGGALTVNAQSITQGSRIVLPSGQLSLNAAQDITLAAASNTDVSGRNAVIDGQTIGQSGGQIKLNSASGNVVLAAGSRVDVSGAGSGGRLGLSAPQGGVSVQGNLLGTAGDAADGARLTIDSGSALDIAALATRLKPGQGPDGTPLAPDFTGAIHLRQREGDMAVGATTTLTARDIALEADGGALNVRGTLDASASSAAAAAAVGGSARGGAITLAARDDLLLAATAALKATGRSTAAAAGLAPPLTAAGAGSGGEIDLMTAQGTLVTATGSQIDVGRAALAPADAQGGRVLLRAPRTGVTNGNPGGTGVAIAAIGSTVTGASRVDVEAVKTYALATDADGASHIVDFGSNASSVSTDKIASDSAAWIGNLGQRAEATAQRLAGNDAALLDKLRVHAAADITTSGDLSLDTFGEWVLPSESADVGARNGGQAAHVGDTSISLRAAGNVTLPQGISSGVANFVQSTDSGSLRMTAGADLAAAAPGAVVAGSGANLVIGNSSPSYYTNQVQLRTTTGNITLAAAGDINLQRGRASVYTEGVASTDDAAVAARNAGVYASLAFRQGGGSVTLDAGGSVLGRATYFTPGNVAQAAQVSQWHESNVLPPAFGETTETGYWTSNDSFDRGVATFGGGNVTVRAGQDVTNLIAAAPTSGLWTREVGASAGPVQRYGGGDLRIEAGRDVVNGLVQAGGGLLDIRAGRDVAYVNNPQISASPGLVAEYENTQVLIDARRNATVGNVGSTFTQNTGYNWTSGLDGDASLRLQAGAGDLTFRTDADLNDTNPIMLLPAQVRMAAPNGSVTLAASGSAVTPLLQQPRDSAAFQLLAGQNLTLDQPVQINATRGVDTPLDILAEGQLFLDDPTTALSVLQVGDLLRSDGNLPDRSGRAAVELAAAQGDLNLTTSFATARPLRAVAGRDIALSTDSSGLLIQQQAVQYDAQGAPQPTSELSLLKAGRDIELNNSGLQIDGPGDLVLLAGRNVDAGTGTTGLHGVVATGNQNNTLLPATGASISVVAGLSANGADYTQAVSRGFEALGASALNRRAGDVYALLIASPGSAPPLGGATAKAFDAAPLNTQLAQVQSLLGPTAYNQALATYVRSQPGKDSLSDSQALAAFGGLSDVARGAAPGVMLSGALGTQPQPVRVAFIAQVAQADAPTTAAGLVGWMKSVTGQALTLPDALTAFEALPVERQLSWLDQVLVDEVRTNGRVAAQASGADKEAAYARAYQAIASIFPVEPSGTRPAGDVLLPNAQFKTLQQAGITIMAPGGGVNAGGLSASTTSPNDLGIVTVAGGDISAITRDDFLVNQSRVFTLAQGDVLLWSSLGNIDAGRGAKTLVGAPAPVLRLDAVTGRLFLDTSGSFTGSGIAVLDAASTLDLYAPTGAIDAGEAGIKAAGNVFLGATVVRGADNLSIGGTGVGAPPPAATVGVTAGLASAGNAAAAAARTDTGESEDEKRKRRRARRNLLLEFLGFGAKS